MNPKILQNMYLIMKKSYENWKNTKHSIFGFCFTFMVFWCGFLLPQKIPITFSMPYSLMVWISWHSCRKDFSLKLKILCNFGASMAHTSEAVARISGRKNCFLLDDHVLLQIWFSIFFNHVQNWENNFFFTNFYSMFRLWLMSVIQLCKKKIVHRIFFDDAMRKG